jgi:uncharacterized membrane protein
MTATTASGFAPAGVQSLKFGMAQDGHVRWTLKRNCSLSPRQSVGCLGILCGVCLGVGAAAWWLGARLVLPFAALEVAAVVLALWMYSRHAADRESIEWRDGRLTVEHHFGTKVERFEFAPGWVRVESAAGDGSLIELSARGRSVAVGRYVAAAQRPQLAEEIRRVMHRMVQRVVQ